MASLLPKDEERRYRAMKFLKKDKIKAILVEADEKIEEKV